MIVAGEASGDLHGSCLAREILGLRPDWEIIGAGGAKMRAAGVRTLINSDEIAVVGIVEVLSHFSAIRKAFNTLVAAMRTSPPDVLVLIDYPDFNLRLAKKAHRLGIPIIYYISPQVWAWRAGRVKTIARLVQRILVLFPFEEDIYRKAGMDCRFVGHPLLDEVLPPVDKETAHARLGLSAAPATVALLPGSRRREVETLFPAMVGAAKIMVGKHPKIRFLVPVASTIDEENLQAMVADSGLPVTLVREQVNEVLAASDAAVVASGTATLQTALMGRAMVIVYTVAPLTYFLGRMLIKLDCIGLANLVAGKKVAPELIQDEVTPERIAEEVEAILTDPLKRQSMERELASCREKLGGPGAAQRAAENVVEFVEGIRI